MMIPNRVVIRSPDIFAIGYDPDAESAYVEYYSGAKYVFRGVPALEFANLRDASSINDYLNDRIKKTYVACRIG
jgi:KTSC domain